MEYEQALQIVKQVENVKLDSLNEKSGVGFEVINHIPVSDRTIEFNRYVKGNNFQTFAKEVDVAYESVLYNSSRGIDWSFSKWMIPVILGFLLFIAGYQVHSLLSTPPAPLPSQVITRPEKNDQWKPIVPETKINNPSLIGGSNENPNTR